MEVFGVRITTFQPWTIELCLQATSSFLTTSSKSISRCVLFSVSSSERVLCSNAIQGGELAQDFLSSLSLIVCVP